MSVLYITEFARFGRDAAGYGGPVGEMPPLATQFITTSGVSAQSAAFNAATRLVRVHNDTTAPVNVKFGANPTAVTVQDMRMAGNTTEYFMLDASQAAIAPLKLAAIVSTV
jgi:hypothetical protein